MAQLALYIDDQLAERLNKAVKAAGKSKSKWVAEAIRNALQDQWPDGFFDLAGSWEEIWRSLESVEFFDLDQVVEYSMLLENATTAAKVGFFLEQHRESLMVDDAHLDPLRKLRPRQPHYLIRGERKGCQWVKNWNLMIPAEILNKSWGEVL